MGHTQAPDDDIDHAAQRRDLLADAHADRDEIRRLTSERDAALSRLDKYRTALESIGANTCCGDCHEAKLVALSALDVEKAGAEMNQKDSDLTRLHGMALMNVAQLSSEDRRKAEDEYREYKAHCICVYGFADAHHAEQYGWIPAKSK
jgi:hypothetical protein